MKCELIKLKGLQRKLEIKLPAEQVQKILDQNYRKWQKKVSLSGFRKGKTPLQYIQSHYQREVKKDTAIDLINESYQKAVLERQISPAGAPEINFTQPPAEGKSFDFSALLEIHPVIQINKDFKVHLKKNPVEISEQEAQTAIDNLRKTNMKAEKPEKQTPLEMDSAFLKKLGCKNEGELKQKIKDYLKSQKEQAAYEDMREQALKQLVEKHPIELVPEKALKEQKQILQSNMTYYLKARGLKEKEIAEQNKKNEKELEKQADFIVRSSYLIYSLAKALKLSVSQQEIQSYLKQTHSKQPTSEIQNLLIREKTLARLIDTAEIT